MNLNHRQHLDFNDGWQVRKPTGPFAAFNDGPPVVTQVTLPHDAMREQTRGAGEPGSTDTGYYPSGSFTYEKTFDAPAEWAGQWVALQFDGVASNALVYLNNVLVAQRPYTYARFTADLTALLKPGESNHLRVEVRNHRDSRWYPGAGIYRQVELLVADSLHFEPDSLWASTVSLDGAVANIDVSVAVSNAGLNLRMARVELTLTDPDGQVVAVRNVPVSTLPGQQSQVLQHVRVEGAQLWSPETPVQYQVSARIIDADAQLAATATKFGIRVVTVDPVNGFRLNGKNLKLRGACIHVDNGLLGAASFAKAELRKVAKLQQAGFNAVRISHNPASQAFLDACDQLGMLVMNEAYDTWSQEKKEYDYARHFGLWWEQDLESWVRGSRNHPSVVFYSLGNEIPELGTAGGRIWNRKLATKVRSLDSTRPITNGINTLLTIDVGDLLAQAGGLNAFMGDTGDISAGFAAIAITPTVSAAIEEVASVLDVVGYNYAESRYALDLAENPHWVVVGSETFPKGIVANWKLVQQYPHVIGDFTWTGWDYLGEVGIGAVAYNTDEGFSGGLGREFPYLLAYCGDIDITGYRRPASYYREIAFGLRTEPFIAVQDPARYADTLVSTSPWAWADVVSGWSWAGFEGKPVRVEVYADAQEVELLLNGEAVGRAPVGDKFANTAYFDLVYQPGQLVAVAFTDGREVGCSVLTSAVGQPRLTAWVDEPVSLAAAGSPATLLASGQDLAHVQFAVVDEAGVLFNQAQEELTVSISGPAVLAGFGSSLPNPTVPYTSSVQTTHDGRALAIVRATGAGAIVVTVTGKTLGSAMVELIAQ